MQLGQRGARAAREQRSEARRSVALFGGFCAVTGVVSLLLLPAQSLAWLLLPLGLAALVALAIFAHVERSSAGEMLVAVALSSVSVPVALAGESTIVAAFTLLAVFASVFISATVSVRAMIGRVTKAGGPSPLLAAALTLGLLAALTALALAGRLAPVAPYAAMPVCAVSFGLTVKPPSPKHLRTIGWTLVGATIVTAVVLIAGLV